MNRRTFLKSLGIACGAAVVCPGELLKSDPWIKAAALRKKNAALDAKLCYGKHGQHCCCNSCVIDIMADCLPPLPWKHYYANHQYFGAQMKKLVEQLEKEFWNTTFKSPFMKEIDETNQT